MTTSEFSDMFDTLLNSYANKAEFGDQTSGADIALDEYEKSVILTQAQDVIVKSYFDKTLNNQGQGFDDSARRQVDFSSLIKVDTITAQSDLGEAFDERGIIFKLPCKQGDKLTPEDEGYDPEQDKYKETNTTTVLFILNEKLQLITTEGEGNEAKTTKTDYVIVPINYREYDREMSKAYAQPLKKQAWRLFQNAGTGFDVLSEIIPIFNLKDKGDFQYRIRYVRRPQPIVVAELPDGLSVDGETKVSECELNPILHMDILNKAVEIALTTRGRVARPTQSNNQ